MIRDTAEANRYAEEFGLLDQVRLASRLPETAICITSEKHDTHWLLVGLFRGFAKPEDNGMNLMAFPKSKFTLEQVHDQLRSYMGSSYIEIKKDSQPRAD